MEPAIYKILRADEWQALMADGTFNGAPVDLADGYVHLSTGAQVRETAARHFAGEAGLMLVVIDPETAPEGALRYEPSRGGDLFPHLYAPLTTDMIESAWPLSMGADGIHDFWMLEAESE